MLANNVKLLGQMIGNILLPVVAKVLPYLNALVIALQRLFAWLAKILGIDLSKLQASNQGFDNSNLSDMLDDAENLSDALDDDTDSAKKLKKQLQGFDALNNLTTQEDSKAQALNAGQVSGLLNDAFLDAVDDYLKAWDEAFKKLENKAQRIADKIVGFFKHLAKPLAKAWAEVGKTVVQQWKNAGYNLKLLFKQIGKDFWRVWDEDKTTDIFKNILLIWGNIGETVQHVSNRFREAWVANDNGYRILASIRDIILIVSDKAKEMSEHLVEWAKHLDFKPLLGKANEWLDSIKPIVESLMGVLEDFFDEVLLPLGKWVLEKGLPDLLQVFIDFNNKVDWESLRANLKKVWEHLEPFAEKVGEGLIKFLGDLTSKVADWVNSDSFEHFIDKICEWMDSVTADDVAKFFEKLAWGIGLLKASLVVIAGLTTLSTVVTSIANLFAVFGIGGGGVVAGEIATVAGEVGVLAGALDALRIAIGGLAIVAGGWSLVDSKFFQGLRKLTDDSAMLDTIDRMEKKYSNFKGFLNIFKDAGKIISGKAYVEGGIEGVTNTAESLTEAMEKADKGFGYTEEELQKLAKRFNWTEEDIDTYKQHILDLTEAQKKLNVYLNNSNKLIESTGGGHERSADGTDPYTPEWVRNLIYGKNTFSFPKLGVRNTGTTIAKELDSSITEGLTQSKTNMFQKGIEVLSFFTNGIVAKSPDVKATTSRVAEEGVAEFHSIENKYYDAGREISVKVISGMESNSGNIASKAQALTQRITSAFSNARGLMQASGTNLMSGLLNGIMSLAPRIISAVTNVANAITSTFSRTWRIHSPSLVMDEMGTYFMQGLQNGIESMYAPIEGSLTGFENDLTSVPEIEDLGTSIGNISASQTYSTDNTETNALLRQQNSILQAILEKEFGISSGALFASVQSSADSYYRQTGRKAFV